MTQIRFGFPARRNSSGGSKERCSFFCECMSESAAPDDDTVRTSSSFFLLHTPGATQQVRNKPEEIFSLLVWHQITGRCPRSFLIFRQTGPECLQHTLPSLLIGRFCVFLVFFISQSKQQLALVWVCFCSPFKGGQPAYKLSSHLLPQPLSGEFIRIQITNNQTSEGSFG